MPTKKQWIILFFIFFIKSNNLSCSWFIRVIQPSPVLARTDLWDCKRFTIKNCVGVTYFFICALNLKGYCVCKLNNFTSVFESVCSDCFLVLMSVLWPILLELCKSQLLYLHFIRVLTYLFLVSILFYVCKPLYGCGTLSDFALFDFRKFLK